MFSDFTSLIFDLDGTISDPSLGIHRCFNYALESHGLALVSDSEVAELIGPPLDHSFARLCPDATPSMIESLINQYRVRYSESGYAENQLYPGIKQAVETLSAQGVKMGICTTKRRDFAEMILSMFGIASMFDFISGGDIGISKSMQIRDLLDQGVIDNSAIMIGDRHFDIIAAKSNGLRSVGVLWGFGDKHELVTAGADNIIESTADIHRAASENASRKPTISSEQ